jgi:hypothetical protein
VAQIARTLFVLVTNLAFIAACVLLLVLFFRRRKAFRTGYIIMLVSGAAVNAIEVATGWLLLREATAPTAVLQIAVAALQAVVWILYMKRSRRVARTFVR